MAAQKVLMYDGNDHQLRAGLGPFDQLAKWKQESLLSQDSEAASKVKSLDDFFAGVDATYVEVSSYEDCKAQIADADLLVVCKGQVDRDLIGNSERLREVHVLGCPASLIDVGALQERGIAVRYTPFTNFLAVAEHALALTLALVKRVAESQRLARTGEHWMVIPSNMRLLREMTVGILGFGEIGFEFARLVQPFGAQILYYDLQERPCLAEMTGAQQAGWDEIFAQSDVVSVHLPLTAQTERIIGASEFAQMKPDALFINTARGELVDEAALIEALQSGQIGGAGLDVFAEEPLAPQSVLYELSHVIVTPHTGWAGPWTLVNDVHRLLSGVVAALGA